MLSLVNDLLKLQMAILQIHCYFLLIKCENPLHLQRIVTFYQQKITVYCHRYVADLIHIQYNQLHKS